MAKPRTCEDQYGETWAVYAGDPADLLLSQLGSLNLAQVVLPQETILTGKLPEKTPEVISSVYHPSLKSVILRLQRQHDCVEHLRRKGSDNGDSSEDDQGSQ